MITNRLTAGTLNPPTATVSFPLRRVSCQLLPMTGSTPTPVPKVMVEVRPPSTKVELLDGSNFFWFAHGEPQAVLGNSRVELPVSNTTLRVCGGVPTVIFPNHCRSVPEKKSAKGTFVGDMALRCNLSLECTFRDLRVIIVGLARLVTAAFVNDASNPRASRKCMLVVPTGYPGHPEISSTLHFTILYGCTTSATSRSHRVARDTQSSQGTPCGDALSRSIAPVKTSQLGSYGPRP